MSTHRRFWSYENKIVTVFFFAVGFVFFDRLILNFLMPFIQPELGLSNTDVGLLAAALSLTWAVSSLVGGRASDKVKSKRIFLVVLLVAFSLASFVQGFVGTFAVLIALRLLMGVLEGPVIPITQAVLAVESSPRRRGLNLGLTMNTANGLFGSVLAPVVIVALANAFGWRTSFFLTVVPGLIIAALVLKIMREPRADEPTLPGVQDPGAAVPSVPASRVRDVVANRNVLLSIVMFSGFMVYLMAMQVFGPLYLTTVKHFSTSTMSLVMSAFGLGTALWGFLVPMLSDRWGRKPTAIIFGALSILAPLSLLALNGPVSMAIAVFIFAAGMGAGGMAMSVIPTESVSPLHAGLAVGIPTGVGELIGGFLTPIVAGAAADQVGLYVTLLISAGGALVATLVGIGLRETAPRKVAARAAAKTARAAEPTGA